MRAAACLAFALVACASEVNAPELDTRDASPRGGSNVLALAGMDAPDPMVLQPVRSRDAGSSSSTDAAVEDAGSSSSTDAAVEDAGSSSSTDAAVEDAGSLVCSPEVPLCLAATLEMAACVQKDCACVCGSLLQCCGEPFGDPPAVCRCP